MVRWFYVLIGVLLAGIAGFFVGRYVGMPTWKPDIRLAAVAAAIGALGILFGVWVAWWQLNSIRKTSAVEAILHLDFRWEHELRDALEDWREVEDELGKKVDEDEEGTAVEFADKLKNLRASTEPNDKKKYSNIMAILGFFETLGFMVTSRKSYLDIKDADGLLGHSILHVYRLAHSLINGLREEDKKETKSTTSTIYEHLISLVKKCAQLRGLKIEIVE